ncbi:hypothetical protein [Parabacteroides sp. FAFU027]|uniref:hypothetical protein n=1 Tax=Parabacteroides sp. FAFU027 TaxID=2922715 RepID=UPI001FAFB59E|nr:hypothetical protein [Parabacteroides sp. FAFU027]
MAKVKGIFNVQGTVQNVSFYTMRGSDEVIMRAKGGPKKSTIKRSEKFAKVRLNNHEWKGCTQMGSGIKGCFWGMSRLADYPFIGSLNALAKKIQLCDTENPQGERSLYLSRHKELITGFNLNKNNPFDSLFKNNIGYTIDRESLSGNITIPRINTEVHLNNYRKLPLFRLIIGLGCMSDIGLDSEKKNYIHLNSDLYHHGKIFTSEWMPTQGIFEEQKAELIIPIQEYQKMNEHISILLCVGIEFGTLGNDGKPVEVKYAGAAKILTVV